MWWQRGKFLTIFTLCANIYAHNKNVFIYVYNNLPQIEYGQHYEGNIVKVGGKRLFLLSNSHCMCYASLCTKNRITNKPANRICNLNILSRTLVLLCLVFTEQINQLQQFQLYCSQHYLDLLSCCSKISICYFLCSCHEFSQALNCKERKDKSLKKCQQSFFSFELSFILGEKQNS